MPCVLDIIEAKDFVISNNFSLFIYILGKKIEFEHIGGATDSRSFALRGSIVIMHSGTGEGMHANGEYVEVDSVKQIAEIQTRFLDKLAKDLNK